MNIEERCKCRFCGNDNAIITQDADGEREYRNCPICGHYILPFASSYLLNSQFGSSYGQQYDLQKLRAYLYHNKMSNRNAFVGTDLAFEQYKRYNPRTVAFEVTPETVENWYPKTFEERIDYILLLWAKKSRFIGDTVQIYTEELASFFFLCNPTKSSEWQKEVRFIIRYLGEEGFIEFPIEDELFDAYIIGLEQKGYTILTLSAKAWRKVYELQKSKVNNRKAFVAMKFGVETYQLRDKIKEGIESAGFVPCIMDEIEHNHQIVPEMLHQIKNSCFVIVELSHHNNGAYYEAGFAYGLGKEVIHICSADALKSELHFDVQQVNTIVYKDINEIPEKLKKRIEATIV